MPPQSSGRQLERTVLAWSRTALSALAVTGLLMKVGISRHSVADIISSILTLTAALILVYGGARRREAEYPLRALQRRTALLLVITCGLAGGSLICALIL